MKSHHECVVCVRVDDRNEPDKVLGLLVVIDGVVNEVSDLDEAAELISVWALWPQRLPLEEGWQSAADLPDMLWGELMDKMAVAKQRHISHMNALFNSLPEVLQHYYPSYE